MLHVLQQHLVRNLQDDGLIRIGCHGVDRAGVDDKKFICPDLPLAAVTETHFQTAFQKINDLQIVVPVRREKEIQIGQHGRIVAKGRGKRGVLCNFFCG